ncbi:MAG: TRAP transporter substrate-binding protein DctP [Acidobacteriia bacterium]|nr:TRAP transporter substrate-binding protein DctP [Terriglobia bacterium]
MFRRTTLVLLLSNTRKTELPPASATRVFLNSLGARTAPFALATLFLLSPPPAAARTVRIKLATLAPKDSSYHRSLVAMADQWKKAPGGGATLVIYPQGVQGGEAAVMQKLRAGQLQAAMVTAVGLSEIDGSVAALQNTPLLFRTLEELDHVRDKLHAQMEKKLADRGFIVLFWADAGWVRFFSTEPVVRPADLRKLKLFVWQGDNQFVDMIKSAGYQPVPLETSDIYPALQSGMIQAVPSPNTFALSTQLFTKANHMLDLKWAPLVGGAVLSKKVWDTIAPETQKAMLAAAQQAGRQMKTESRREEEQALQTMKSRGLIVHELTPKLEGEWRLVAELAYPYLRGKMVQAELFDEVRNLLREYRGEKPLPPANGKKQ